MNERQLPQEMSAAEDVITGERNVARPEIRDQSPEYRRNPADPPLPRLLHRVSRAETDGTDGECNVRETSAVSPRHARRSRPRT